MNQDEREFVVGELAASEARLLRAVDGLSVAQWSFREASERWSIAEIVEHLAVFEEFIRGAVQKALAGASEPEKMDAVAAKEPLVMGLATSRGTRFQAREATRPVGRWMDPGQLVEELRKARARTVAFAEESQADLRGHFFAHIVFGDLDCYQWLLVLGQHMLRHVEQMEEIKRDAVFPVEESEKAQS
jgi:uncharacterized damage-inducible protein DinB